MRNFCTYFDHRYVPRALALYESFRRLGLEFRLFALCMDEISFAELNKAGRPGLIPIAVEDFERGDTALQEAKQNRSHAEYFFTCTPSLCLYVLRRFSEVELLTYLDADLYFYSSPEPLFAELGSASIGIVEHRYSPRSRHYVKYGIYNVGWLSFRADPAGFACIQWWRERCLEWCYDRLEGNRFADQKYLDDWPTRFVGVRVLRHKGANVACWNLVTNQVLWRKEQVWIDEQPLIFFHFTGVKEIRPYLYQTGLAVHRILPNWTVRQYIFGPYIHHLKQLSLGRDPTGKQRLSPDKRFRSLLGTLRNVARLLRRILCWDYLFVFGRRVY